MSSFFIAGRNVTADRRHAQQNHQKKSLTPCSGPKPYLETIIIIIT